MSKLKTLTWPQVVLFGDSITQGSFQVNGWGAGIADKLARKCDVINRGFSGYNSRWGRIVLPRILYQDKSENIAAVTVFFGANDCSQQDKNPQQHVPLDEYSKNLKAMSSYLTEVGVPAGKVIFITPAPINEAAWEKECKLKGCPLNRLNSVAGEYAQACVQAASQCGVDVLDLWTLMQKDGQDFTVYLSDGLHLSAKGNQFVMQHLWELLESKVAHLPLMLPYWGIVNVGSPESSLLCDP
ncbi:isoamyl acetate-hydrolyzing esterase 1 homolog [Syngnathus scovelli]|uniref:isoamyl acetate-hydrolyzing esterase 1 homolog n=1 Tax=Syngnathus scovelli TaxID=161590 RepID=UPI002110CEF3|nr:isoamyl acetate-hydrolyzing esterase 1 homolog [Syngnathus scovelli]